MWMVYRQTERLKKGFLKLGARELVHDDRGRLAAKNLPGKLKERAITFSKKILR